MSHPNAGNCNSEATDEIVAHVNARTFFFATGLVFHVAEDFLLMRRQGVSSAKSYFD